jgi:hypothetical protein
MQRNAGKGNDGLPNPSNPHVEDTSEEREVEFMPGEYCREESWTSNQPTR